MVQIGVSRLCPDLNCLPEWICWWWLKWNWLILDWNFVLTNAGQAVRSGLRSGPGSVNLVKICCWARHIFPNCFSGAAQRPTHDCGCNWQLPAMSRWNCTNLEHRVPEKEIIVLGETTQVKKEVYVWFVPFKYNKTTVIDWPRASWLALLLHPSSSSLCFLSPRSVYWC